MSSKFQEKIWQPLVAKNPDLLNDELTLGFKPSNVEKMLLQVWNVAHKEGVHNGKALAQENPKTENPNQKEKDILDEFGSFFGGIL